MLDTMHLRRTAEKCRRRAEALLADAETLRRFGEDLAELAQQMERAEFVVPPPRSRRN